MHAEPMSYAAHARAILRLGLPLIGGHLGQVAIGVTDTVMLGWFGVEEELPAATLGSGLFFLMFLLGSGFAWAVMPMVAKFAATDDQVGVRRATRMGLWLSLAFAVLALPILVFSYPILIFLRQDPHISELAAEYLLVASWGMFPALIVMTLKSYLAALERTQIVFWMTMAAALTNAIANYALIFGNWGMPELGITGAAIASVLTQLVMLLAVVVYALRALPEHELFRNFWRPDWPMLGRVFLLGTPIGLTTLSEAGLFTASALLMGVIGAIPLAAHGIALNIASVTFMVHLGLSNVATIRVGNAIGRGDKANLLRGAKMAVFLSIVFSGLTVIAFLVFPEALLSLFMDRNAEARDEILRIGVLLLAMAALFQLVDGLQVIALGLLRGAQDTRMPMILAAIAYWLIGMPVAYAFGIELGWDGVGVWLGLCVGLGGACVFLHARFWRSTVPTLCTG